MLWWSFSFVCGSCFHAHTMRRDHRQRYWLLLHSHVSLRPIPYPATQFTHQNQCGLCRKTLCSSVSSWVRLTGVEIRLGLCNSPLSSLISLSSSTSLPRMSIARLCWLVRIDNPRRCALDVPRTSEFQPCAPDAQALSSTPRCPVPL